jgi:hypothetical protein
MPQNIFFLPCKANQSSIRELLSQAKSASLCLRQSDLGPMLWFLKYFRRKIKQNMAFLTQNNAKLFKILIITLFSEKNANFFAENCRKSPKIVIITLTPASLCLHQGD